jgi:exodeoxyribonuclease VII small subunit
MSEIPTQDLSFEQALSELEKIVKTLESGTVELESAIALYSRGVELKKHCDNMLDKAKVEINKVIAHGSEVQAIEPISIV